MKKTLHLLFLLLMLAAGANTMSATENYVGSRSVSPETPSWWMAAANSKVPTWFEVYDYDGNLLTGDNIELVIVEGHEKSGNDYDGLNFELVTEDDEYKSDLESLLNSYYIYRFKEDDEDEIFETLDTYTGKFHLKPDAFGKAVITASTKFEYTGSYFADATPVSYTVIYRAYQGYPKFSQEHANVAVGEEKSFTPPTLTWYDDDGSVLDEENWYVDFYKSSNKDVATVDNNGNITFKKPGTTTIKVQAYHDDDGYYHFKETSYTLTYEAKVSLDESSDNADVLKKTIEGCKDGTTVAADLTRTLVGGKWNTLCLPFSTAIEGTALEGAVVKEIGSIEDNVINLVDATKIEAGKPYLVKPQQDVVNPRFHNALFTASSGTATGNDTYSFVGAIAPKTVGASENIWGVSASGKLAKVKVGSTINGMRAYFVFSGNTAAKLNFDGEATGINGTEATATAKATDGKVYNLDGQCVGTNLNALPHGLYIVDGKKVMK